MSTTEQKSTTEFFTSVTALFDDAVNLVPFDYTTPYKLMYGSSKEDVYALLAHSDEDVIVSKEYKTLSKHNRVNLPRCYDLYHEFEFGALPGDRIIRATLYTFTHIPKDLELREKYFRGEPLTEEEKLWNYEEKNCSKIYIPVKTVENITGPFTFFDKPIPVYLLPYNGLSVEIEYEGKAELGRRRLSIENYTLSRTKRNFGMASYVNVDVTKVSGFEEYTKGPPASVSPVVRSGRPDKLDQSTIDQFLKIQSELWKTKSHLRVAMRALALLNKEAYDVVKRVLDE